MWNGFVKTDKDYYGRIWYVRMWNPETKETMSIACEDTDYNDPNMGTVDHGIPAKERLYLLDREPYFDGRQEVKAAYEKWRYDCALAEGHVRAGMTVRVVKGRKWPIGMEGKVVEFYDWHDRYGRLRTRYCVLEDGKRVNVDNVVPVA